MSAGGAGTEGLLEVRGHPTWTAVRGSGPETLLVLHGALSSSRVLLDALGEPLAERYRVVAFDRRGHGGTADTPGPLHYTDMADETVAVLEQVVGGRAHLVGWSDGGIVALLVALRRPELVDRLVVIGTNFHHDGLLPLSLDESSPIAAALFQDYAQRSPDGPEHFPVIVEKSLAVMSTEPTLTPADVAHIAAPTLVMAGDDDGVRLDHTCALFEALPAGQLCIVPGASHALPLEHPGEVAATVRRSLAGPVPPATMMPLRRAAATTG